MDRAQVQAFIEGAFARCYGAAQTAGYSDHLTVRNRAQVRAALGYRRAGTEPLFLEQYLDRPIEECISGVLHRPVERERIIEVGNLAAENAWSMIALWGEAANDLGGSNEVVVATLTAPLRRMFARIGVPVHELAAADPARLGTAAADWGAYYAADPRVCAGEIAEGQRAIAAFLARRQRDRAA
jgi:hypothetical protein